MIIVPHMGLESLYPSEFFREVYTWGVSTFPQLYNRPEVSLNIAIGTLGMFAIFSAFGGLMVIRGVRLTIYKKKKR